MKKYFLILNLLVALSGSGQQNLDIPPFEEGNFKYISKQIKSLHLNDLTQNNNDLSIRVWMGRQVVEINRNKDSVSGKIVTFIYPAIKFSDKIISNSREIEPETVRELLQIFNSRDLFSMKGEDTSQVLFHGDIYIFETSGNGNYRIFSYFPLSGTEAEELIHQTEDLLQLDVVDTEFINSLPPGFYFTGLSPAVHVDTFCPEGIETSSLYQHVKKIITDELFFDDTQDATEFPYIILNHQPVKMCDLNQYEDEQVDKIKFFSGNEAVEMFGEQAEKGVVYIGLKN